MELEDIQALFEPPKHVEPDYESLFQLLWDNDGKVAYGKLNPAQMLAALSAVTDEWVEIKPMGDGFLTSQFNEVVLTEDGWRMCAKAGL